MIALFAGTIETMNTNHYIPESYWNAVAEEIELREINTLIAGDADPYYLYKRKKFLQLLNMIPFSGKKILEIGCGPGGNLVEIYKQHPAVLYGADISVNMLELCKKNVSGMNVNLEKINGENLPYETGFFDIVFTSTVLQHITDDRVLQMLLSNIQRVAATDVFFFEQINKRRSVSFSTIGRQVEEYKSFFSPGEFQLLEIKYLNVYWSRMTCGLIRRVFNVSGRKEAGKQKKISIFLQKMFLPFTRILDNYFPVKNDLAMLHFRKQ